MHGWAGRPQNAPGRTQVVIQRTAGARELEVRLHGMLAEAHRRL